MSARNKKATNAVSQLTGVSLTTEQSIFVIEYCKDFDHRRAAMVLGMHPDEGTNLLGQANVGEAVRHIYNRQLESSELTPEVIKEEMYDLYSIAVQKGQLNNAAKLLDMLAKHSHIDAYAAQKVAIAADAEVARALSNGRKRMLDMRGVLDSADDTTFDEPDFM